MGVPLSPDEQARIDAYYGGAGLSSPAAAPPPPPGDPSAYFGPPSPQVDSGPLYPSGSYADAGPPPPAAPAPHPFSWNAPGFENKAPSGGAVLGRTEPGPAPPPVAPSGGSPSPFARGGAPSDLEPSVPAAPPGAANDAAKALAQYGGVGGPAKPKVIGGGGHGGPRGPSDYEKGVAGLRSTYGDDKGALQRGAAAEEARADTIAEGAGQIARTKQDDEAIQRVEAANAAQTFADYSAETQKQIDDVRSKTIDPNRAYSDTGSKVTAVLGGLLGGLYQGLNHLSNNPFIDQMNKVIDRDIAAQETDLRTKKESIGERKGLLAEMRATYKDEALAKIQARNLYYEGAKEELMAQAAQYDSPAIQARADQAITAMTREQTKLDINEAIRKAAAAQAASAAAEHRRQIDFENALKRQHAQNETVTANANAQKTLSEGGKDENARFVGTGKDAQGNPTGYLERNVDTAKERETSMGAAQKLLKQIDRVQAIRREQGAAGRAASEAVHGIYDTKAANELAVLESDMTTTSAQAAHLGALSESDRGLLTAKFRNLNSPGGGADERLDELRRITQAGLDAEAESASGARATKVVSGGREQIVPHGTSNALNNQRTVAREPVK